MSFFITFEGVEGSGKSTQAKQLAAYLEANGYKVLLTREPGGPSISEKIRETLLDKSNTAMFAETELLLYMASRAQHTGEWIIPALKRGEIVISDRYIDSSYAYQGGGRQLDMSVIETIGNYATFGLKPDITVLLDIPVEVGMERMKGFELDRIELEHIEFHRRVREFFLNVAKKETERYIVIDGCGTPESIQKEIREKILSKIKEGKR